MATRPRLECPICHDDVRSDGSLEDHLVDDHTKRKLAKFVAAEVESLTEEDISE